jgi:hypothetical protein
MAASLGKQPPAGPLPETRLESDQEIRQALEARRARRQARAAPPARPGGPPPLAEPEVRLERPSLRPPMALLCVLDDGKQDGEWFRLRADRTVIGRAGADVCVPHDVLMSAQHAEIVRQQAPGGWRWLLADLQSTNGTFVRIGSSVLAHDNEFLVGAGRYRFEGGPGAAAVQPPGPANESTQAWFSPSVHPLVPSLVELSPAGPVHRFALTLPEYWLGRDPSCAVARPDDPLVSPRHARLFRDTTGRWHVENNKSANGLWLAVKKGIPLSGACQFRLGEQRFLFRVA